MKVLTKICLATALAVCLFANAQLTPFHLRLIRDRNLGTTLQLNDCITGKLYNADPAQPILPNSPGFIAYTLELPWRNDLNEISSIPAGTYSAVVRDDGPLGWRMELLNTGKRKNIQIHIGQWPRQTEGCVLIGISALKKKPCEIYASKTALQRLRAAYGSNISRPIVISITGP